MFKRILVVMEPTLEASAALNTGAALAKASQAELVFCSGRLRYRAPFADLPDPEAAAQWVALDDGQEQTEQLLRQATRAMEAVGVMSRSVFTQGDDPVHCIVESAQSSGCDLILVAKEDSNAVVRLLTGNIVPGLVTASPLPVWVCAASARVATLEGAATALRRIMVVLDDDDLGQTALSQGLALAHAQAADLCLVHVLPPEAIPVVDMSSLAAESGEQLAAELRAQARRLLASAATVASDAGVTAQTLGLPAATTARDIARLAVDQSCDLIIIAHRGSNAVVRLLTGSLIPGLITAATLPVLICRAQDEALRRPAPRRRRHHRHKAGAAARVAHRPTP